MSGPRLQDAESVELLSLLEQREREKVAPKLEAFRKPMRIKGAVGGRGAGAKSWSLVSLLVQEATYQRQNIACLREVQYTLEESVWKLFGDTIARLGYGGWSVNKNGIDHVNGSHVIFRGLSDMTAENAKSLEGYDRFLLEEAQALSANSLNVLFPTARKPGSEIWFAMNPNEEVDPILARTQGREDALIVFLEPGATDNPWWTAELQAEMERDFTRDPELADHVWNGKPRIQGARAAISRAMIREAMERKDAPHGLIELGVDVARFGDDRSVIAKRDGMRCTIEHTLNGADTQEVARIAWETAGRDPNVAIKVDDDGVGGGVTDKLRDLGANVIPCHNGGNPNDEDLFTTSADEQWFTFPIESIQLPNDPELAQELSGRQYSYTRDDKRKIESKGEFKKRYGRSPDKADAVLLCFYRGKIQVIDEEFAKYLAARRSRG
jgi:phage terminase large subunit